MKVLRDIFFLTAGMVVVSCGNGNKSSNDVASDSDKETPIVNDSALYGIVGRATAMHTVEIVDENGKSTTALLNIDMEADVQGGIYCDDHLTMVLSVNGEGEKEVVKAINLTSLCGHWTSLDRNFEIMEDGTVISMQNAETHPYTHWSMVNCNLILNRDTFDVAYLGPDSLALENDRGIFVYKRVIDNELH